KGDHPAEVAEFAQHDLVNEQSRGDAEGDEIGQGIELAAKGALVTAEPGEPSIEQVENAGGQNEPDGVVEIGGGFPEIDLARAIIDAQDGREAAEEVACGHEIGQEINLRAL